MLVHVSIMLYYINGKCFSSFIFLAFPFPILVARSQKLDQII